MIALDKIKHLKWGAGITTVCALATIFIWKPILHPEVILISGVIGSLVGIGKELIWDKLLGKGTPEFADGYATVWSSLLTAILIYAGYTVYLNYSI